MGLLLPADCLLCKRPLKPLNRSFICLTCWQKVEWLPSGCCIRCGKPLFIHGKNSDLDLICFECKIDPPHFQRLFSPTVYRGVMAEAIRLFKYNGKRGIIRGFAQIIKICIKRFGLTSLGLEAIVPVRYTKPQTRLKKQERRKNVKDAFSVKKSAKGQGKDKKILLVDDVYTTGITLNEASYEMKKDGAQVFSFTLARVLD